MKNMKNFNYKIREHFSVYRIAFFECQCAKLNNQKLDIQNLLNLSKDEFANLLYDHNFLSCCSCSNDEFYKYEIIFKNKKDAEKFAKIIESYIILNKLVGG